MSAVRRCTWPTVTPGSIGRSGRARGTTGPWAWLMRRAYAGGRVLSGGCRRGDGLLAERLAVRDREHDVLARDRDELVRRARPLAADELDRAVRQRDEVAVGAVEEVRETAAIAVGGQRQEPGDAVALGLDVDPLVAMLHS